MIKSKHIYELLDALHPTIWKTPRELWNLILQNRHELMTERNRLPSVWVYVWLNDLCVEGLVVDQERPLSVEHLRLRNGYREFEYRLTEEGLRKRLEHPLEIPDGLYQTSG